MTDFYSYWGKAKDADEYHLLVYHSLDVAAVGRVWMDMSPHWVERVSRSSRMSKSAVIDWFSFFLSIHDLGKFDVRFQGKVPEVLVQVQPGVSVMPALCRGYDHGKTGYEWTIAEAESYCSGHTESFLNWARQVCGHHGRIPHGDMISRPGFVDPGVVEHDATARNEFIGQMKQLLAPNQSFENLPENPPEMLAGFCSVCDWIGSNEHYFPLQSKFSADSMGQTDLENYFKQRLKNAAEALNQISMIPHANTSGGMHVLFPDFTPRGVQKLVSEIPIEQNLTVIEAPTGSGKTEAALAYASLLVSEGIVDSIIFALPTQATTNAMLPRAELVAHKIFTGKTNVVLAHGKAGFNEKFIQIKERSWNPSENEDCRVQCSNWLSSSKKRSFLGQLGICTIDQVLLSVLPVKHHFVRSFGLGRSVLIVDEVHAYDNYMYGLLEEVLREQRRLGGSAILLSATMTSAQKQKMFDAWNDCLPSGDNSQGIQSPYPLVTSTSSPQSLLLAESDLPDPFTVKIETVRGTELSFGDEIIAQIVFAAKKGASVGVICNVVADAQKLAKAISEKVSQQIPVDIFHSRFQFEDRLSKEKNVVESYGKAGNRCGRILVATQVIEQSLDIDFDWMITQICPVDLLFQRLGRLHRHDHERPIGFEDRKVTIVIPDEELTFGGTGFVYENTVALWKTQKLLEQNDKVSFPSAYREWIERVYSEDIDGLPDDLKEIYIRFQRDSQSRHRFASQLARNRNDQTVFDDALGRAGSLTRDGEMSISLIPFWDNSNTFLDGDKLNEMAEYEQKEKLSMCTVPVPNKWKHDLSTFDSGFMKLEMTVATPGVFETQTEKYDYRYTRERGMERKKR